MTQYKVSWDCQTIDGVQHMEEIDKDFGAASYHALSLRNRGYQNVKVEVVHTGVKKSERQYVALLKLFGPNRVFRVVLVGKPGEAAEVVGSQADVENSDWGFIKVVTLSVAKRSYKRAWKAWEASQQQATADYWRAEESNQ